jgi:hypothetical protein
MDDDEYSQPHDDDDDDNLSLSTRGSEDSSFSDEEENGENTKDKTGELDIAGNPIHMSGGSSGSSNELLAAVFTANRLPTLLSDDEEEEGEGEGEEGVDFLNDDTHDDGTQTQPTGGGKLAIMHMHMQTKGTPQTTPTSTTTNKATDNHAPAPVKERARKVRTDVPSSATTILPKTFQDIVPLLHATNHRSKPIATKYEYTRIKGHRMQMLADNAISFVNPLLVHGMVGAAADDKNAWKHRFYNMTPEELFMEELRQQCVPLIIVRHIPMQPLPEYWRVSDLDFSEWIVQK